MDDLMEAGKTVLGLKGKLNDDVCDRLSSRYTTALLIVFAAMITIFQLGDYPITCWFPAHFHDSHEKFANAYCWIKNTYYLPYDEFIPGMDEDDRQVVTYYQWVPFILLIQALLFKFPGIIWNGLNSKAGLDADDIMVSAMKLDEAAKEERREAIVKILTLQLDRFLSVRRPEKDEDAGKCKNCMTSCCSCCGKRYGWYLTGLFLFIKLIYIANVLCQIFALNKVLNTNFSMYGFEVLKGMPPDHEWEESPYVAFPRVTMCDFQIRRLGNIQRYTLQCTLPLNLINEKMYMFLWFWFIFVLICSILGFLQWFLRSVWHRDRKTFLKNHLGSAGCIAPNDLSDDVHVDQFINEYLRQDGMFLMRLISHNTNNLTTREIIASMWDVWFERRDEMDEILSAKLLPNINNHNHVPKESPNKPTAPATDDITKDPTYI